MFDLLLTESAGCWVLEEEYLGEVGVYRSRSEALAALAEHTAFADADRQIVLVLEADGQWDEIHIEPSRRH